MDCRRVVLLRRVMPIAPILVEFGARCLPLWRKIRRESAQPALCAKRGSDLPFVRGPNGDWGLVKLGGGWGDVLCNTKSNRVATQNSLEGRLLCFNTSLHLKLTLRQCAWLRSRTDTSEKIALLRPQAPESSPSRSGGNRTNPCACRFSARQAPEQSGQLHQISRFTRTKFTRRSMFGDPRVALALLAKGRLRGAEDATRGLALHKKRDIFHIGLPHGAPPRFPECVPSSTAMRSECVFNVMQRPNGG